MAEIAESCPSVGNVKHELPVSWAAELSEYSTSLSVSSDSTLVAVGTAAGELCVFETQTGALRFRVDAHPGGIFAVEWSPKERLLASAGQDGNARIYDAEGKQLAALPGGSAWVEYLAWSPNGKWLATAAGRIARLWTSSGAPLLETQPHESALTGLAWNRNSTELATACYGGVRLFEVGERAHSKHLAWPGSLISLSWSPTGSVIACGTHERSVHFWRLRSGRESEMSGFAAKPRALEWDTEGRLLATSGDSTISVWSFDGKGPEGKPPIELIGHRALCTTLAFHPKSPRLASGSDDTGVLIWEPRNQRTPLGFGFLEETVTALAWAHGGRLLIGSDAMGTLRAWDVERLPAKPTSGTLAPAT